MPPGEMFGRTMSIPDTLLPGWYQRASGLPEPEVREILAALEAGRIHPRDAKMRLGRSIVALYHGPEAAAQAEGGFVKQFQKKELPDEIEERRLGKTSGNVCTLLVEAGLAATTSDVRRAMDGNGVKVHADGGVRLLTNPKETLELPETGLVVQVGKRRFARLLPGN
jgi:tyrosyl-tRNA synthetase